MSEIDVSRYLKQIRQESPCGDYLEYDTDYIEMERLSEGSPERQVGSSIIPAEEGDWRGVKKLALNLLTRTRDVYVSVYLAIAEARLSDLEGVANAFALIEGLLEKFWDDVHPAQDPEDAYPMLRMNALANLNDFDSFLKPLRDIPLATSNVFPFSLRDYEIAIGKIDPPLDDGEEKPSEAQLKASFLDSDKSELAKRLQLIESIESNIQRIIEITNDKVGTNYSPNLSAVAQQLNEMKLVYTKYAKTNDPNVEDEVNSSNSDMVGIPVANSITAGARDMGGISSVNSREDVSEAIDLICGYYDINEPASPIPFLLKRAKGLLDKNFMEILQDVAPAGVSEAEKICGDGSE